MAAIACSQKDPDDPVATWTYKQLAEACQAEGIAVSTSQLWRILDGLDLECHMVRGWLNRRDGPEF